MTDRIEQSRVADLEMAVAMDPDFEWHEVDGRRDTRRLRSGTGITPWATNTTWRLDQPDQVVAVTEVPGVPDSSLRVTTTAEEGRVGPRQIVIEMTDGSVIPPTLFARLRLSPVRRQLDYDLESPVIQCHLKMFDEEAWSDPFARQPRPGRRGRPDWHYALWSRRYVTALKKNPRKPVALLSDTYPGHSPETIRSYLNKARNRGLLTDPPKNGVPGGRLTKRCQLLLEQHRDAVPANDPLLAEEKKK